jgi:hypothetical protein
MKTGKSHKVWLAVLAAAALGSAASTHADAVTDWNAQWDDAVISTGQPPPAQARFAAILHIAVFDAVNGIARKYSPYYVIGQAPPGAREEAAAVQAAHTVLKAMYPSRAAVLDEYLAVSLAKIPGAAGNSQSIAKGRAWGHYVAWQILELRDSDGWSVQHPPYFGTSDPGVWRSIPFADNLDGTLPALFAQVAFLAPFAMETSAQFRPGPPYASTLSDALSSIQYAEDVNEVKAIGRFDSALRTPEQTELARLWQAMGPVDENRAARSVVPAGNKLVDNARMFALLNIVGCDALIASMDSKFVYNLWRPHHAIRLADTDGNPLTEADPDWTALILAPRFQEYVANHAVLTGAIMHSLARLLGDEHTFTLGSPNYPGITWTFERFSDAAEQAKEARIWGGIHFRNSCNVGQTMGQMIADYVLENFLLPLH